MGPLLRAAALALALMVSHTARAGPILYVEKLIQREISLGARHPSNGDQQQETAKFTPINLPQETSSSPESGPPKRPPKPRNGQRLSGRDGEVKAAVEVYITVTSTNFVTQTVSPKPQDGKNGDNKDKNAGDDNETVVITVTSTVTIGPGESTTNKPQESTTSKIPKPPDNGKLKPSPGDGGGDGGGDGSTTSSPQLPTIITNTAPPGATIPPDVLERNLQSAKGLNLVYAGLTPDSPCQVSNLVCINGQVGTCNAATLKFNLVSCGDNMRCWAMPAHNTDGVNVGCANIEDAKRELGVTYIPPWVNPTSITSTSSTASVTSVTSSKSTTSTTSSKSTTSAASDKPPAAPPPSTTVSSISITTSAIPTTTSATTTPVTTPTTTPVTTPTTTPVTTPTTTPVTTPTTTTSVTTPTTTTPVTTPTTTPVTTSTTTPVTTSTTTPVTTSTTTPVTTSTTTPVTTSVPPPVDTPTSPTTTVLITIPNDDDSSSATTPTSSPGETPPGETPPGETPPGETPPGETPPGETPPGEGQDGGAGGGLPTEPIPTLTSLVINPLEQKPASTGKPKPHDTPDSVGMSPPPKGETKTTVAPKEANGVDIVPIS